MISPKNTVTYLVITFQVGTGNRLSTGSCGCLDIQGRDENLSGSFGEGNGEVEGRVFASPCFGRAECFSLRFRRL
jgi:hypothetical protein